MPSGSRSDIGGTGSASRCSWRHVADRPASTPPTDSQSHPLQLAAYALHPVGFALEWLVMRPIHFVVSQPKLDPVFGHVPHESPFGDYEPYQPESR